VIQVFPTTFADARVFVPDVFEDDRGFFKETWSDPKYAALKGEGVQYHTYGWPAPPSDKVQLITNSYILPNMIAKAVTGTSTKDAMAWAENEMKKIIAG